MQQETTPSREIHHRQPPFWLTEPCPAWCDGRHHVSDHPEDRKHGAETPQCVELALYPACDFGVGTEGDRWRVAQLIVYMSQDVEGGSPKIRLVSDDVEPRVSLDLRVAEAGHLADQLLEAVARVTAA